MTRTNSKVVIAYGGNAGGANCRAIVGTVSVELSISFGSAVQFNASILTYIQAVYDSTNEKVVITYRDDGNSDRGTAIVGTVSGDQY